jgi:hypothetical protein
MIIKPIDKNRDLPAIGRNIEYYHDEWGNEWFDIIRRISLNDDTTAGRMERISIVTTPDCPEYKFLYKESGIGFIKPNRYNNTELELIFDNYMSSSLDYLDGSYLNSGGYCSFPLDTDSFISFGDTYDMPFERVPLNDKSFTKRTLSSLEHTHLTGELMDVEVQIFEDEYQLPYTETIGLINTFFSTWGYGYPFETTIIIDCKRKEFNIPRITYLPIVSKDKIKNIYMKFIKEVGLISDYLFRLTEHEKRNIKFIVFFHPFGSIVKIKDLDRHTIDMVKNYNANQPHALMKNVYNGGLKYISGESFKLLRTGEFEEPIMNALECSDILY